VSGELAEDGRNKETEVEKAADAKTAVACTKELKAETTAPFDFRAQVPAAVESASAGPFDRVMKEKFNFISVKASEEPSLVKKVEARKIIKARKPKKCPPMFTSTAEQQKVQEKVTGKNGEPKEVKLPNCCVDANGMCKVDALDLMDPQSAAEYAYAMYQYHRRIETKYLPELYMISQVDINERMRAILIDWLVEVHLKFKLEKDTLYLTVHLIDRLLERKLVQRQKLQLVGVTAMLIASKYEEIYAPEIRDFVYISDNAYTKEEIVAMEGLMLNAIKWMVTTPTILTFVNRFTKSAAALDLTDVGVKPGAAGCASADADAADGGGGGDGAAADEPSASVADEPSATSDAPTVRTTAADEAADDRTATAATAASPTAPVDVVSVSSSSAGAPVVTMDKMMMMTKYLGDDVPLQVLRHFLQKSEGDVEGAVDLCLTADGEYPGIIADCLEADTGPCPLPEGLCDEVTESGVAPVPTAAPAQLPVAKRMHSLVQLLTQYYAESMLQEYSMISYKPSVIAAAAVALARRTVGQDPQWSDLLVQLTSYRKEDICDCLMEMEGAHDHHDILRMTTMTSFANFAATPQLQLFTTFLLLCSPDDA
jgi:hypothetical protein